MKKKSNWFLRIVFVLFLAFLAMYISSISGYKEKRLHDKVIITEDKIKEFESDILAGKNVEITKYLNNDYVDYSNKLTKAGDAITETIQSFLTDGLVGIWNTIKVLFW